MTLQNRSIVKHKYGAKAVIKDGARFDSKMEMRYYNKLKLLQSSGEVLFFIRQVPFHLPGNIRYVADFMEFHSDGTVRVVDVKGYDTPMGKMKRKQVEAVYPVTIEIVTTV